jgi:hypothetical protein
MSDKKKHHRGPTMEEFAAQRMERKKRRPIEGNPRMIKLDAIPGRYMAFKTVVVPWGDIDFAKFGLPPFQREHIGSLVNVYADVLRRGGSYPAIDVSLRPSDPGRYWIIDGQQRFWAHFDAGKDVTLHVHEIDKIEVEKMLFIALNNHRTVSANIITACHIGPITTRVIVPANEDPDSPLRGRVSFRTSVSKSQVGAAMLASALGKLVGVSGNIQTVLTRLDVEIQKDPGAIERFKHLIWLIGSVFFLPLPGERPTNCTVTAFAIAWRQCGHPSAGPNVLTRLRRVASKIHKIEGASTQERRNLIVTRFCGVFRPVAKAS